MIFRTLFFIFVFVPVLIVIVPIQFIITRLGLYWSGLPLFFHKVGCVFLGIRVKTIGEPLHGRPTLLLSNHISWTDIIVIGSVADVTFVAKTGVRNTFFVGFMASLQRTLYVDYHSRKDAKRTSEEMAKRLSRNFNMSMKVPGSQALYGALGPFVRIVPSKKPRTSAARLIVRLTDRPPWPTFSSRRSRIGAPSPGIGSGGRLVAHWRAAQSLRAWSGSTRVSLSKTVKRTAG